MDDVFPTPANKKELNVRVGTLPSSNCSDTKTIMAHTLGTSLSMRGYELCFPPAPRLLLKTQGKNKTRFKDKRAEFVVFSKGKGGGAPHLYFAPSWGATFHVSVIICDYHPCVLH